MLVSFSQNSSSGAVPSGPGPASSSSSPRNGCGTATDRRAGRRPAPAPRLPGVPGPGVAEPEVGSTCSTSASGPALVTCTVISRSSGRPWRSGPRRPSSGRRRTRPVSSSSYSGSSLPAPAVLRTQVLVRERALRVVVAPPVPGVARHGVEVPPVLLDVLAVVALAAGQPESALLEDRVAPVPQRQRQAQPLLDVAEPGQPVLAPPVGPGPGVVVRQVAPRLAVGAVVLPDRAPLPLAEVRTPQVPVAAWRRPLSSLPNLGPAPVQPPLHPPGPRPRSDGAKS